MIRRQWRVFTCCLWFAIGSAGAETFRIALLEYPYAEVWRSVVAAMQAADPANRYDIVGAFPARRLVELGRTGQYDFYLPSGSSASGKTLFGFEAMSDFAFYDIDLVLASRKGVPALDDADNPIGEIEGLPGTEALLKFKVTGNNQIESSLRKLLAGRIAGVVNGRFIVLRMVRELGADQKIDIRPIAHGAVHAGFVQQTGWQEKARHVDGVLEKIKQSGTLTRLLAPILGAPEG